MIRPLRRRHPWFVLIAALGVAVAFAVAHRHPAGAPAVQQLPAVLIQP